MAEHPFCFCVVASRDYIADAAGLWANVRAVHPGVPLVVLATDETTHRFFTETDEPDLLCVSAEEAWGARHWRNLRFRTSVRERAYASKSALLHWILDSGTAEAALLLDADAVLVDEVDGLIDRCKAHDALLVPTRHDLASWRRSQNAGIFSAGVVGFSVSGRRYAAAWRAMCFEQCTVLPIDGIYNEQGYLAYLIGHADTDIVRDPGINVSATILPTVAPEKGADGTWRAADSTPIRLFHVSRNTDPDHELSRLKSDYDRRALKRLGGEEHAPATDGRQGAQEGASGGVSGGRLFERVQRGLMALFRSVMRLHRAWQGDGAPLRDRLRGTFHEREALEAELWSEVGDEQG